MNVEIVDRNGWKYALIRRPRGQGRAFLQSLGTKSEKDAREKIRASSLEAVQLAAQADALTREVWIRVIAGRKVRVRDAVLAYKEHRTIIGRPLRGIEKEQRIIDAFLRFTGIANDPINVVEGRHVSEFVNQASDTGLTTRVWWLSALTTWLAYCVEQRWLVKNPAVEVVVRLDGLGQSQLVSNPYIPFTNGEVMALLAAIPKTDFWHGAVLIAYTFGLRMGAIATLEYGNIVANRMRIFTTKGRKILNELIPDELIAWFDQWKSVRPFSELEYIFPVEASIYLTDPAELSRKFKQILNKNGIRDRVFHGLRKTASKNRWEDELKELGTKGQQAIIALVSKHGMKRVQEMLGHSVGSSVTSDHYLTQQ